MLQQHVYLYLYYLIPISIYYITYTNITYTCICIALTLTCTKRGNSIYPATVSAFLTPHLCQRYLKQSFQLLLLLLLHLSEHHCYAACGLAGMSRYGISAKLECWAWLCSSRDNLWQYPHFLERKHLKLQGCYFEKASNTWHARQPFVCNCTTWPRNSLSRTDCCFNYLITKRMSLVSRVTWSTSSIWHWKLLKDHQNTAPRFMHSSKMQGQGLYRIIDSGHTATLYPLHTCKKPLLSAGICIPLAAHAQENGIPVLSGPAQAPSAWLWRFPVCLCRSFVIAEKGHAFRRSVFYAVVACMCG